jgi:hypothetical protein
MDSARARDIQHEIDYWLGVLEDIGELNNEAEALSRDLANAAVALLSLISLTDDRANEFVRDGLDATNAGLKSIMRIQEHLMALLRLAEGRHTALRAQVAGE